MTMHKKKMPALLMLILCLAGAAVFALPAAAQGDLVYFNPEGGRYYHSFPQCETIRSEYHSLMQSLPESRLTEEAYSTLMRCNICFRKETQSPQAEGAQWMEVVYWNPDGGRYYHTRSNCEAVAAEYQPLMESLKVEQLAEEPYCGLERCALCQAAKPEPDRVTYFRHRSTYDTAPEGFSADTAGLYTAGVDIVPGVYTVHLGSGEGELYVFAENGDILHRFAYGKEGSASFYLAQNMSLRLPEGCTMTGVEHKARFQSVYEKTEIINARYFVMVECPGLQYWVQSREGCNGSVTLYSMDAENGLAQPVHTELGTGEPVLINLQGGYDTFVEFRDCIIWPAEAGEG